MKLKGILIIFVITCCAGCSWFTPVENEPVKYIKPADFVAPKPIELPEPPEYVEKNGSVQRVILEPFVPAKESASPGEAIRRAEITSKEKATDDKFINAITEYEYQEGKIYEIYIAKQRITNILFQEGEDFTFEEMQIGESSGMHTPVKGFSGSGNKRRVNLMLRPKKVGVNTNMVIPTNKRTYYLNIKSFKNTFQTGVNWIYPKEEYEKKVAKAMIEHRKESSPGFTLNLETANMNYDIIGNATWKPVRVLDNGKQTCISLPDKIRHRSLPAFFLVANNNETELVNYHYDETLHAYIVHRLFDTGVLKLGKGTENEVFIYNKQAKIHQGKRHTTKRYNHAM